MTNQNDFTGWAKVEVMGHQHHIGYVTTETFGAAVLFRIDSPEMPEREFIVEKDGYENGHWVSAGTFVKKEAVPGISVLVGSASIYRIIPCSEEAARKAIDLSARTSLKPLEISSPQTTDEDQDDYPL